MRRAFLALLFPLVAGACSPPPRTTDKKEIYVEPFRDADYEMARLPRRVAFPLAPGEEPRCFSLARAFENDDERLLHARLLLAAVADTASTDDEGDMPDPTRISRPPTQLIIPDRTDVRDTSACYLGHCAFLDRSDHERGTVIHHLRLLIVNREKERVTVPITSFKVWNVASGYQSTATPLELIVAATDRGVKVPETIEVPVGEQRTAHFFFRERVSMAPALQVSWTATVQDRPDAPPHEIIFEGQLVKRYVCLEAPVSPLEDHVARGLLDLPEPGNTRADWIDPGLSAVPGVGK